MLQTEGTVSAKGLRQELRWYMLQTEETPVWPDHSNGQRGGRRDQRDRQELDHAENSRACLGI